MYNLRKSRIDFGASIFYAIKKNNFKFLFEGIKIIYIFKITLINKIFFTHNHLYYYMMLGIGEE